MVKRLLRIMAIGVALGVGSMLLVNVSFQRGELAGVCADRARLAEDSASVDVPQRCFGPTAPPWSESDPVPW